MLGLNAKRLLMLSLHNATVTAWRSGRPTCLATCARCSELLNGLLSTDDLSLRANAVSAVA
jgi:hypothetical protein